MVFEDFMIPFPHLSQNSRGLFECLKSNLSCSSFDTSLISRGGLFNCNYLSENLRKVLLSEIGLQAFPRNCVTTDFCAMNQKTQKSCCVPL